MKPFGSVNPRRMIILRILGYAVATIAFLLVMAYVFLNVHPAAWQYAREFRAGTEPPAFEGAYDGTLLAPPIPSSWKGKTFRSDGTGINRVGDAEAYPFDTARAGGRLLLKYDRDPNPWWLRQIEDQIVIRADGSVLGRVTIRIGSWRIPIGWFTLTRAES